MPCKGRKKSPHSLAPASKNSAACPPCCPPRRCTRVWSGPRQRVLSVCGPSARATLRTLLCDHPIWRRAALVRVA